MKSDFDYSAYVGHNNPPPDDEIQKLTKKAEELDKLETNIAKTEITLEDLKAKHKQISEKELPEQMESLGLKTFETASGVAIKVTEKVRGALTPENKEKGFAWLEKNGFSALIKSEVIVPFKRNELEEASKLVEELQAKNRIAELERNVHVKTLEAFIREQLAQGKEIPLDIFSVYRQRIAKVEV